MPTDIRSLPAFTGSDANFRTWAQGVHAALLACGLVNTADTGQADLTTILTPGVAGGYSGFKMYRFDDALQATKPVFIKVEFGAGSGSASKLALAVTVGTATNGAGGFPGITQTSRFVGGGNLARTAGQVLDTFTCGRQDGPDGGRIHQTVVWDPAGQYSTTFLVERLKNGDGTPHESGAVFCGFLCGNASNQIRAQVLIPTLSPTSVESSWPMIPMGQTNQIQVPNVGTDLALSPLMYAYGVWLYAWPLCYRNADLAAMVPFTMDHLGDPHTFMPFGVNQTTQVIPLGGASTLNGNALIWE